MTDFKPVEIDQFNGDLISRKASLEHIKDLPTWWADGGGFYPGSMKYPEGMFDPEDIINSIENAPAVEAEPVRHGRWRFCGEDRWNDAFECSECGKIAMENSDYCPHCGAKMDGGNNVERIMDL